MEYYKYTNEIHQNIGMKIYNKELLKNKSGDVSIITYLDIIEFVKKENKNIEIELIKDILNIWSHDSTIKFHYYGGKLKDDTDLSFYCNDWYKIRPVLFLILIQINYF
jgi:hypothetical protein